MILYKTLTILSEPLVVDTYGPQVGIVQFIGEGSSCLCNYIVIDRHDVKLINEILLNFTGKISDFEVERDDEIVVIKKGVSFIIISDIKRIKDQLEPFIGHRI